MSEGVSATMQIARLAVQLGVIVLAVKLCGKIARKLHIPTVGSEILVGILIGPCLLGAVSWGIPGFEHGLFPVAAGASLPVSVPLYAIAVFGSVILLFVFGLETDLPMFFRYSMVGTVIGFSGVVFSYVFGDVLGMILLNTGFMDPRCMFLGILSTATSVGITAHILSRKKNIDSPEGTAILAAAVTDSVLGIIGLAIVLGIVSGMNSNPDSGYKIGMLAVKSIGIGLVLTVTGLLFSHSIARFLKLFKSPAVFCILTFGFALLLAGLLERAGLAMIVGAYIVGLSLSKTDIAFPIQRSLRPVYDLLVPVFFVVMGMLLDIRVLADKRVLLFGLIYSLLAILAKIIGCALPAFFMNFNMLGSLRIGTGMIPRGELSLIIAGIGATTMVAVNGIQTPILDPKLFGVTMIMIFATALAASPLLSFCLSIKGSGVCKQEVQEETVHTAYDFPSETIADFVLAQMIVNFQTEGFRHSAIDRDSGLTYFRRVGTSFTLRTDGCHFDFESSPAEVILIKTVIYETVVDLFRTIGNLRDLTIPGAFEQEMFERSGNASKPDEEIKLDSIIQPGCLNLDLKAQSQEEAISELVDLLAENGQIADREKCEFDVLARESIVSTCVSNQMSFPHARTDGTKKFVAAVGISRLGFKEFRTSGPLIRLVVLSMCPPDDDRPYLQFISAMAAKLNDPEKFRQILNARTIVNVRACLSEGNEHKQD